MWASGWDQSVSDLTTADSGRSALWPGQLGLFACVRCKSRILRSLTRLLRRSATLGRSLMQPREPAHIYILRLRLMILCRVDARQGKWWRSCVFDWFLFILSKVFSVQWISAMFKHLIRVQVCVFICLEMPIKPNYYRAVIVVCGPHCDLHSQNLDGA